MRREFTIRRKLLAEADPLTIFNAYALFLFSPGYANRHPDRVAAWIDRAASGTFHREISLQRTDMIMAYDGFDRLSEIRQPCFVLCGDRDFCTPPHVSEEIVREIPGAEFRILADGGHMIHDEQEDQYFETVHAFLARH